MKYKQLHTAKEYYDFTLSDWPGRIPFDELKPETRLYWEEHFMNICRNHVTEEVYVLLPD